MALGRISKYLNCPLVDFIFKCTDYRQIHFLLKQLFEQIKSKMAYTFLIKTKKRITFRWDIYNLQFVLYFNEILYNITYILFLHGWVVFAQ